MPGKRGRPKGSKNKNPKQKRIFQLVDEQPFSKEATNWNEKQKNGKSHKKGRPSGSSGSVRSAMYKYEPENEGLYMTDEYFKGMRLPDVHSIWKGKTGKTTSLDEWKARWEGNTREIRKRMIMQIRGLKTHKPYKDSKGNVTKDSLGRVMQDSYNKGYFHGMHLEKIFNLYQKRTGDMRPFKFWEDLYEKSRRRIRTALIKGLNGKLPKKATVHIGPVGPPRKRKSKETDA